MPSVRTLLSLATLAYRAAAGQTMCVVSNNNTSYPATNNSADTASNTPVPAPAANYNSNDVSDAGSWQWEMLRQVNVFREANGKGRVCLSPKMTRAAQLHSEDMSANNFFSHTGSNGSAFSDRIIAQGLSPGASSENIAAGQTSVTAVMTSWINSDGHRENLLSNAVVFGCGEEDNYWTQVFSNNAGEVANCLVEPQNL